jgi:hypothetical protein
VFIFYLFPKILKGEFNYFYFIYPFLKSSKLHIFPNFVGTVQMHAGAIHILTKINEKFTDRIQSFAQAIYEYTQALPNLYKSAKSLRLL